MVLLGIIKSCNEAKILLCRNALLLSIVTLGLVACGGTDIDSDADTEQPEPMAEDLFQQDKVLNIELSFAGGDWDSLRRESNLGRINGGFGPVDPCFEYSEFYGTASIDGHLLENVNITKKGTFGSVDSNRPSLKINLEKGEGNDGRKLFDEKRFTLNNNKQDASTIKQCLAYHIFNLAGIHAPRCNFANVSVEGQALGVYSHVEAIKKPFLKRTFGNKSGNLYEIQRDGAFIESRIEYIEAKTNEDETDRAELYAVVNAMNASDDNLWAEMSKVINMDYLITFVAIEALVGHTDGFTGYQNNVYFYHNPGDNLLYFIPWGADQTFRKKYIVTSNDNTPASILLGNSLIQRLWQSAEFRANYDLRLLELLDTVWDEAALIAMADTLAGIVSANNVEVDEVRNFILERRTLVENELDGLSDREGQWRLLPPTDQGPMSCSTPEPTLVF